MHMHLNRKYLATGDNLALIRTKFCGKTIDPVLAAAQTLNVSFYELLHKNKFPLIL